MAQRLQPWGHPEIVSADGGLEVFDTRVQRPKTADQLLGKRTRPIMHHQKLPTTVGLSPDLFQEAEQQGLTVISWRDDQKLDLCRFANHARFVRPQAYLVKLSSVPHRTDGSALDVVTYKLAPIACQSWEQQTLWFSSRFFRSP